MLDKGISIIGWMKKGFDFLGFRLSTGGIKVSKQTLARYKAKIDQLYEQGATNNCSGTYWRYWLRWCKGGIKNQNACHILAQLVKFALKIIRKDKPRKQLILGVKYVMMLRIKDVDAWVCLLQSAVLPMVTV